MHRTGNRDVENAIACRHRYGDLELLTVLCRRGGCEKTCCNEILHTGGEKYEMAKRGQNDVTYADAGDLNILTMTVSRKAMDQRYPNMT